MSGLRIKTQKMLEAVVKDPPSKQLKTLSLLCDTGTSVSLIRGTAVRDRDFAVDCQSTCPKIWAANNKVITNYGIIHLMAYSSEERAVNVTYLVAEDMEGAKALICQRTYVSMTIVTPEFVMGSTPLKDGHAGPGIKELPREQVRHGFRSLPARTRCRLSFPPSEAGGPGQGQQQEAVTIQVQPTARVKRAKCTQMLCQFRHNCVGPKHCCQGTG